VGRVSIVDSTGGVVDRVVSAPTCAEVSLALALISSIAMHDIPTVAPVTKPSAAQKPALSEIEWSLGAVLGIHKAVAPGGAPTFGVAAGVRSPHTWASPEARVELLMTSGRTDSVGSDADPLGKAVFNWYGGRVTGCPLLARKGRRRWPFKPGISTNRFRSAWLANSACLPEVGRCIEAVALARLT